MVHEKGLKIERLDGWNNEADQSLIVSVGNDYQLIKDMVNHGSAKLYKLDDGDAWLVARVEGNELVCMCFEGVGMAKWARAIIQEAKKAGLASVRMHTNSRAVARIARSVGATIKETVYEVIL